MEGARLGEAERSTVRSIMQDRAADDDLRLWAAEILLYADESDGATRAAIREIAYDEAAPGSLRLGAVRVLAEYGDPSAQHAGRTLLVQSREAEVLMAALDLLQADEDPGVLGLLRATALQTEVDRTVRSKACELLANRPGGRYVLTGLITDPDGDGWVRAQAMRAVAATDSRALHRFLDTGFRFAERLWLGRLLMAYGDTTGADLLTALATDPSLPVDDRRTAAHELITRPRALTAAQLAGLVEHPDLARNVRIAAVKELCLRADHDALDRIRRLATDTALDVPYRAWAAWTLVQREDTPAPQLLAIAADSDIDEWVRLHALDSVAPQALRAVAVDPDRSERVRNIAFDGLLRRMPLAAARVLESTAFDRSADEDLRRTALTTILADSQQRTAGLRALAEDARFSEPRRRALRTAADHPDQRTPLLDKDLEALIEPAPRREPPTREAAFRQVTNSRAFGAAFERTPPTERIKAEETLAEHGHRPEDRRMAATGLLTVDPERGMRSLRALVEDPREPAAERLRAATTLITVLDVERMPTVIDLLTRFGLDVPAQARREAFHALRTWGKADGDSALRRVIADADAATPLRLEAAAALADIPTHDLPPVPDPPPDPVVVRARKRIAEATAAVEGLLTRPLRRPPMRGV